MTHHFLDPRKDYKKMLNDGGQENKICMNYVVNQHIIFRCTRKKQKSPCHMDGKIDLQFFSVNEDTYNNNTRFIFLCHNFGVERYFFARFVIENKRFSLSFCASSIFQQKIF